MYCVDTKSSECYGEVATAIIDVDFYLNIDDISVVVATIAAAAGAAQQQQQQRAKVVLAAVSNVPAISYMSL